MTSEADFFKHRARRLDPIIGRVSFFDSVQYCPLLTRADLDHQNNIVKYINTRTLTRSFDPLADAETQLAGEPLGLLLRERVDIHVLLEQTLLDMTPVLAGFFL